MSSRNDETKNDLQAATDALGVRSKDSNDLVTATKREEGDLGSTPEFAGNNYWRPPTTDEDLDEMLRAEGMLWNEQAELFLLWAGAIPPLMYLMLL